MAQYTENEVIRILTKRGVNVARHTKLISLREKTVGINTWGKIDYLVNKKGYRVSKGY